jgi:hypothetical protein
VENLILGKWLWSAAGPVKALGYENTRSSVGEPDTPKRLNPTGSQLMTKPELVARWSAVKAAIDHWKANGVQHIYTYACTSTAFGGLNSGFWAFWKSDLWRLLYGRDRGTNPASWLAVDEYGNPLPYYPGATRTPEHCAPWVRCVMCINNPNWLHWLKRIALFNASIGADLFLDNCYTYPCHCGFCKALKVSDVEALAQAMIAIRDHGRLGNKNFRLCVNSSNPFEAETLSHGVDALMMEWTRNRSWSMADTGKRLRRLAEHCEPIWLDYRYYLAEPGKARFGELMLQHHCGKAYMVWGEPRKENPPKP